MLIDAHHHLWDTRVVRYELLQQVPALLGSFETCAYSHACAGLDIAASICIEAASARADPELETEYLVSQTKRATWPVYMVAYAPIGSPHAGAYVDRLLTRAGATLVGIRRGFEHDDPDLLKSSETVNGLRLLAPLGLPFDVVVRPEMIRGVTALAERCPDTTLILDHMGKPRVTATPSTTWFEDVTALASCTNVWCKISGLMTEAEFPTSSPESYRPYIEHALDVFGPDRILFGSDWPTSTLAGTIEDWLRIVTNVVPLEVQSKLLIHNAQRVYSIAPVTAI